jgi:putative transcriptional regulator
MTIHHHPDDSTLVSHAAGAMHAAMGLVIDCHLQYCLQCRKRVEQGEQLGAAMLERIEPVALSAGARESILARVAELPILETVAERDPSGWEEVAGERLPVRLRELLNGDFDAIRWRAMAPGIHQAAAAVSGARLLRIAPGTSMPLHGHAGSELTMVLRGSYCDEIGRFRAGDVADLDPEIQHQPIADTDQHCICLIATDAPLRFRGLIPRLLQPFFGL